MGNYYFNLDQPSLKFRLIRPVRRFSAGQRRWKEQCQRHAKTQQGNAKTWRTGRTSYNMGYRQGMQIRGVHAGHAKTRRTGRACPASTS